MIQGCTSDAGKSFLVTALCRVLADRGFQVAPFKPQNMALNSAVTAEGGEIGRAQAVQAQAARCAPHVDMNPILLKPNSDIGAQVIVHGHAIGNMVATRYHSYKPTAMQAVLESHQRLEQQADWVVVEGAGSPAEINLRENDIANMGFAEAADCPVILIADIDRGGVFAHLIGTLELLSQSEQARVIGFVINRFRGDISLLQSGVDWLEARTGKPVLGVIPYLQGLHLEAEDAVNTQTTHTESAELLRVVVPVYPRISNHTDFDALRLHPQVDISFIGPNQTIPPADLVVLPGSKSVIRDLTWLREQGWEDYLQRHLRFGGKLLGICGGYQMLGNTISDPEHIESEITDIAGLSFLTATTVLTPNKQLVNVSGSFCGTQTPVTGYEIHCGITHSAGEDRPFIQLADKGEGMIDPQNQVAGSYLHGLFDHPEALTHLLSWAGLKQVESIDIDAIHETSIQEAANTLSEHMDIDQMLSHINTWQGTKHDSCK